MKDKQFIHPLNTILYGPPGTGKTYMSIRRAIQIVEGLNEEAMQKQFPPGRPGLQREAFWRYQQEGKIAFVTFHPSFSYEDFVEGLKPFKNERDDLYYDIEDGIFKQMCLNASYALYQQQQKRLISEESSYRRNFDALFYEFVDYLRRMLRDHEKEVVLETRSEKPLYLEEINKNDTLKFRYEGGSRVYGISKAKLEKLYRRFSRAEDAARVEDVQEVIGKGSASIYWAVFQRLKEFEQTRNTTYNYLLSSKRLLGRPVDDEIYQNLKRDLSHFDLAILSKEDQASAGNFVLIIDEINRGNLAAIMGELISLIEPDKRAGMPSALSALLPYSRERFSVPPNLYLLASMNTADRSISSLDTALRRRFIFEELQPRPDLLQPGVQFSSETHLSRAAETEAAYGQIRQFPDLSQMLHMINLRLEKLLDREHLIGHAYLMPVLKAVDPLKKLRQVFYKQLIPLLQEYLFDEPERIRWVIGPAFFSEAKDDALFFPEMLDELPAHAGFFQKKTYVLRPLSDEDFLKAVRQIYEAPTS
ncbi:MAG: AAA family ATPase [Cyclobacteriaceae bacterium]